MTPPVASAGSVFHATQMRDLTEFLDHHCRHAGAGEDATFAIRLAVEEVFTNILQYGYGNRPGPVTIHVDTMPRRVTVTLVDAAPAFDPADVPTPDLDADWRERRIGGLGWHFVHRLMDEVRWAPGVVRGNVFTLVKSFPKSNPART